jgi:hypothetical protein
MVQHAGLPGGGISQMRQRSGTGKSSEKSGKKGFFGAFQGELKALVWFDRPSPGCCR